MWSELLSGPSSDCQSLHPHRRDGPRPGHPIQRPQLQPARGRGADVSDRLGELSLHHQPGHHREEVPAQLLLPVADSRLAVDDRGQRRIILSRRWSAGQIEQSDVEVKNVTITSMSEETVQGARIARGTALVTIDRLYSPSNSREPRTEHWLLSVTYYLNPEAGQRSGEDLPAVRDDQSARIDHHGVPREPGLGRPNRAGNNGHQSAAPAKLQREDRDELPADSAVLSRGAAGRCCSTRPSPI